MPGRNRDEAWRSFLDPFRKACKAMNQECVLIPRHFDDVTSQVTTGAPGLEIKRHASKPAMYLYIAMTLECVPTQRNVQAGPYRMSTRRYDYELGESGDQLLGWHWHPGSKRSHVKWPHFHMPKASAYRSTHIPTGRIALEDLLLFMIDEMDAAPDVGSARSIIEQTSSKHKDNRYWA